MDVFMVEIEPTLSGIVLNSTDSDIMYVSTISACAFCAPPSDVIVSLSRPNRVFLMLLHISHPLEG